jgi:hypothetical protein
MVVFVGRGLVQSAHCRSQRSSLPGDEIERGAVAATQQCKLEEELDAEIAHVLNRFTQPLVEPTAATAGNAVDNALWTCISLLRCDRLGIPGLHEAIECPVDEWAPDPADPTDLAVDLQ